MAHWVRIERAQHKYRALCSCGWFGAWWRLMGWARSDGQAHAVGA